jgi:nucleoside-diphosphate-sugar epimerase
MYADDLIRWLLKIVNFSKETCPIYNVGSNDTVYIDKLAKALAIKYGLNVKLENLISDKKIDKYIPNIEKAKKELSLYNNLNSLEAIIKTIKILKNNK